MASSLTAQLILDLVRGRHPAFVQTTMPEGALLQIVNTRQRTLLLQHGAAVEGLVNLTAQLATIINGVLVGSDAGVPVYTTTYADGWPVHFTVDNVPYADFTETPIAGDPFGEHGGTPGFPLAADFLKLVQVTCVQSDQRVRPVDVIPETARLAPIRSGVPTAFVSGNRLVPVRALATGNTGDVWSGGNITAVQLSYVALPELTSLTAPIVLPASLHEAMIAGVAESLAFQSPTMTPGERQMFSSAARVAEQAVSDFSVDVVGTASANRVQFRR